MAIPVGVMRLPTSVGRGQGPEMRSSLRIRRATKGLDCDITLQTRTRKAQMKAGGSFSMYRLLALLDVHGPTIQIECSGPDAQHAYDCIAAALDGETTEFSPEDLKALEGQGRYRKQVLADLPPQASARWLAWLREDPSRTLPWPDEPLLPDPEQRYPYRQMGGLSPVDVQRKLDALPFAERTKVLTMSNKDIEEYLCAPDDVRREKLHAIPGPGIHAKIAERVAEQSVERARGQKTASSDVGRDREKEFTDRYVERARQRFEARIEARKKELRLGRD